MNPTKTPSQRLYESAAPVWKELIEHPFVQGIGNGTLDVEKFKHYMLQDYLYLFDYAKVFALGLVKTQDPKLMQIFAQNIDAILNGEMNIHRTYMKRLGITDDQVFSVEPALDNLGYTHYMLAVGQMGGPLEIVAAILACSWSYAEIGALLEKRQGAADHPFYGEWIRGYAGADFQSTNEGLITLMDRLAADVGEEKFAYLTEVFINCCRFELGFWDMAWEIRR